MASSQVVLVNGISATGKTTVAAALAPRLGLPLLAKDGVKEKLFDGLGWSDREWSHRLSGVSHLVLNYVLEQLLTSGNGFVMEANFNPSHDTDKYRAWQERHGFAGVQVLCHARGEVVLERFRSRVERGERHPGHCDGTNLEAFRGCLLAGRCDPLPLGWPVIEVDTSDPELLDWDRLASQVIAALQVRT